MNWVIVFLIVAVVLAAGCANYREMPTDINQQAVETPLDEDFENVMDISNDTEDLSGLEDDLAAIEDL